MTVGRQEFERTRRDLAEARRMLGQLSPRGYRAAAPVYYLQAGTGNILVTVSGTDYYGLKRPSSWITQVNAAVPAYPNGTAPDGLSYGWLLDAAGNTTTVWIGHKLQPSVWSGGSLVAGSAQYDDFQGAVPYQGPFIARYAVRMPITGSVNGYTTVYVPWRV